MARGDLMVVMGDMNARVGCGTSVRDEVWEEWRGSVQQQWETAIVVQQ